MVWVSDPIDKYLKADGCRVRQFGASFFDLLGTDELRDAAVTEVSEVLEGVGRRQHDGAFVINYIRLRFVVQKPHS